VEHRNPSCTESRSIDSGGMGNSRGQDERILVEGLDHQVEVGHLLGTLVGTIAQMKAVKHCSYAFAVGQRPDL
jgi:hypothetical protein